jgi:hypothetical protein
MIERKERTVSTTFCVTTCLLTESYLFVTVPPELPTIIDHWGRQLNTTVGPHNEGDDVILTCRVIGGEFV